MSDSAKTADISTTGDTSSAFALRGRLLLVGAAVLWSISGLLVKSPPLVEIDISYRGPVLACYRAWFAAACLLPLVRIGSIRWRPMLIPMVVSFAAMNVLFLTAMTKTTAAAAIFLQYTSVVWATLFGRIFLAERIERGNLVAIVCSLLGIAWIVAGDWNGEYFTGNLIALGSGLAYGGVVFCLRYLRDEDSAWLVSLNHVVSGAILLPWVWTIPLALNASQWGLIATLGIVQMAVPYMLFARGVRYVKTQEAALIPLLEPILNPVWVWLLWREEVAAATWIGGALIVGGLAVRYLVYPAAAVPRSTAGHSD